MHVHMQKTPMLPSSRTLWIAIILIVAAIGMAAASLWMNPKDLPSGTGTALVGGPFTMVNQKGETVTEKSFAGKYMLVFFGYTFCPDVCPTELQVMSEALTQMGPAADDVVPVFVTIDPERDTQEMVAQYVENFHPRLVGLTGTKEQVAAMAAAYRVFYSKVDNAKRPADYLMDHSSIVYLMDRQGKFLKHFTYSTDPAAFAKDLQAALAP